jgi:hypothetical protein
MPKVAGALLLLFGCAPTIWDKPGATQQDLRTDLCECERDARQSGVPPHGRFYRQCMEARGYTVRQ